MSMSEDLDTRGYVVVVNAEEQYSIWLADKDVPAGWTVVGGPAPKHECLDRVSEVWTDMRPLSLRLAMDGRRPDSMGSACRSGTAEQ